MKYPECTKLVSSCLAFTMMMAGIPFTVSAEGDAPILQVKTDSVSMKSLEEERDGRLQVLAERQAEEIRQLEDSQAQQIQKMRADGKSETEIQNQIKKNEDTLQNKKEKHLQAMEAENVLRFSTDVIISNNFMGVTAASFGIKYDSRISYVDVELLNSTAKCFNVINNPEQHILWFTGANASNANSKNTFKDEVMMTLNFILSEEQGGSFPFEFVWEGANGVHAYWYTDNSRDSNVIDGIESSAVGGMFSATGDEVIDPPMVRMNQNTQRQVKVLNTTDAVFWYSDNEKVATVDSETGLVTAVSPGVTNINAVTNLSLLTCEVTVTEGYYYSIADPTELKINNNGDTFILYYPDAEGAVKWSSAKQDIATIDENGTITIKQEGEVTFIGQGSGGTYIRKVIISSASESAFLRGDVDENGKIDIMDVILLNKGLFGKASLTDAQIKAADINGDNIPDAQDCLRIMRYIVKLETW